MMPAPAQPQDDRPARARRAALLASLVWAGCVLAYAAGYLGTGAPGGAALLLALAGLGAALILPVAVFWALALLYAGLLAAQADSGAPDRSAALQRRIEAQDKRIEALERRLKTTDTALRRAEQTLAARPIPAPAPTAAPAAAPQPAAAPPAADAPPPAAAAEAAQPDLPLHGGGDNHATLSLDDAVRALNFPRDANDREGFAVLSRAMGEPELARLLRSSEDTQTLLAQNGLYMDDLMPAPATSGDWRQFAKGGAARAALMPLNGITDSQALETVRGRMRADPIFRDTALHFQRKFDHMLHRIAPEASDATLLNLVDTRSGRAYVLLVQASSAPDAG
ncbi:hypothetical protein GE300_01020 [Rhodobacteraceae bacterium 2CG4]|uniref:Uncharacterized protein n=1 Tax=Halovulum marinum TaxID=2662447 RepID=A0A6L5YWH1_9RHOB|nr:hypothetical protein [Halovulum marinum]MSU88195.1 hypothetical protein [Halovulum marinum]